MTRIFTIDKFVYMVVFLSVFSYYKVLKIALPHRKEGKVPGYPWKFVYLPECPWKFQIYQTTPMSRKIHFIK